ncbi:MAG: hypothetical protein NVS9B9_28450 [Ktedonobacteraceae bacterium]
MSDHDEDAIHTATFMPYQEFVKKPMTFLVEGVELEAIQKFENEHNKKHGVYAGAIGGRYSYTITRTSIGDAISVECSNCNEEKNVTDYDSW